MNPKNNLDTSIRSVIQCKNILWDKFRDWKGQSMNDPLTYDLLSRLTLDLFVSLQQAKLDAQVIAALDAATYDYNTVDVERR